jgi:hypothetical protein
MNRLVRRIVSWFKWIWVWKQYKIWSRIRVPFARLKTRDYKVIEKREPEFKLVPIPTQEVTENVFGETHTFLAPCSLINLDGRLIIATNNSDRMLRRIVKVERPPIEGAIWTAVIEVVGAPSKRNMYKRNCHIEQWDYAKPIRMDYEFNIHPERDIKASNLMVIPFDSLVKGYKLIEASVKEANVYARTERPGNW